MKTKQYQIPMTESLTLETPLACLETPSQQDNHGGGIMDSNPTPSVPPQGNAPLRF